jgi:hypothetical protein
VVLVFGLLILELLFLASMLRSTEQRRALAVVIRRQFLKPSAALIFGWKAAIEEAVREIEAQRKAAKRDGKQD